MKVLLIAPCGKATQNSLNSLQRRIKTLFPPLGLLTVAGLTRSQGIEVGIIDEATQNIEFSNKWDLVGITANTASVLRAYEIAEKFREMGVPVVLGGIHPSFLPVEAKQYADAVVIGEAESVWHHVLDDAKKGDLQDFYKGDKFIQMQGLPLPAHDLINKNDYIVPNTVQTTRGCPYNCSFCSVTTFFGHSYRTRSIEDVLQEVRQLPGRLLVLVDDNIMCKTDHAKKLFAGLKGLKKLWVSQASLSVLKDKGLLKEAAKSGCRGLFIGFESLSGAVLENYNKAINIKENYIAAIGRLHDCSIGVIGSFMFGSDEDDEGAFERTLRFAETVHLDAVQFSILTPLPGTQLFERLQKEGRILHRNWSLYNGASVVFQPKKISPQALQEGFHKALKKAASYKSILKRLWGLHRRWPVFGPVNISYRRHALAYLHNHRQGQ